MAVPSVWGIHDTRGGSATEPSGCGYLRIILPMQALAAHGWKTGYGVTPPLNAADEADILVGERFDSADVLPAWGTLKGVYKLVYEIDDNPWALDRVNWLAHTYRSAETLAAIAGCAEISDLVIVSCEPLAEKFREFNPNVKVVPNYIPQALLSMTRPRHEKVTIGWSGGVSHGRDMASIARSWRTVVDETGARGHFQGTDYRNMLRPDGFDFTPWEPDPAQFHRLLDFDIGLAPLSDHEFNRYKTAIKAIEYGALGIPIIATDALPYSEYVIDGVTGFLCRTQEEWRDRMRLLVADEGLRQEMGAKAKEQAAGWTIEGNWQAWASAYGSLLEGNHG